MTSVYKNINVKLPTYSNSNYFLDSNIYNIRNVHSNNCWFCESKCVEFVCICYSCKKIKNKK